jgi:hypothetical protein
VTRPFACLYRRVAIPGYFPTAVAVPTAWVALFAISGTIQTLRSGWRRFNHWARNNWPPSIGRLIPYKRARVGLAPYKGLTSLQVCLAVQRAVNSMSATVSAVATPDSRTKLVSQVLEDRRVGVAATAKFVDCVQRRSASALFPLGADGSSRLVAVTATVLLCGLLSVVCPHNVMAKVRTNAKRIGFIHTPRPELNLREGKGLQNQAMNSPVRSDWPVQVRPSRSFSSSPLAMPRSYVLQLLSSSYDARQRSTAVRDLGLARRPDLGNEVSAGCISHELDFAPL